jgi:hypothetical protein
MNTPITNKAAYMADNFNEVVPVEVCREIERKAALLQDACEFIIAHGHNRPMSRIKTVCRMAIAGIDFTKPLRKAANP